jgi:hypothetical protein
LLPEDTGVECIDAADNQVSRNEELVTEVEQLQAENNRGEIQASRTCFSPSLTAATIISFSLITYKMY